MLPRADHLGARCHCTCATITFRPYALWVHNDMRVLCVSVSVRRTACVVTLLWQRVESNVGYQTKGPLLRGLAKSEHRISHSSKGSQACPGLLWLRSDNRQPVHCTRIKNSLATRSTNRATATNLSNEPCPTVAPAYLPEGAIALIFPYRSLKDVARPHIP